MANDGLPLEWSWTELGDVVDVVREAVTPNEEPQRRFNYLSIENVESNTGQLVNFASTLGKNIHSAKLAFTTRDVLYSKLRPYLNKVHLPTFDGISATDLLPLRPREGISREFVAYFLRTQQVVEYANQRMRGIQLPRLTVEDLLSLRVAVPPSAEQRRIVIKIEELFQELQTARQSLQKVPSLMKQFRQSVLEKALRGELTEKDRVGESEDSLPTGWMSVELGTIIEDMKNGLYPRKYHEGPMCTVFRIRDIQKGSIDTSNPLRLRVTQDEFYQYKLQPGDIILDRVNAQLHLVGKTAIFDLNDVDAVFNYHLMRIRIRKSIASPKFVKYALESYSSRRYIEDVAVSTAGQNSINQTHVSKLLLRLPPLRDQLSIVDKLDSLLSDSDDIENSSNRGLGNAELLEQSILAKAFRGELVPQDPNDEPATVLLERIKNQDTKRQASKSSRNL